MLLHIVGNEMYTFLPVPERRNAPVDYASDFSDLRSPIKDSNLSDAWLSIQPYWIPVLATSFRSRHKNITVANKFEGLC